MIFQGWRFQITNIFFTFSQTQDLTFFKKVSKSFNKFRIDSKNVMDSKSFRSRSAKQANLSCQIICHIRNPTSFALSIFYGQYTVWIIDPVQWGIPSLQAHSNWASFLFDSITPRQIFCALRLGIPYISGIFIVRTSAI